jgi:alpha-L-fucosidase
LFRRRLVNASVFSKFSILKAENMILHPGKKFCLRTIPNSSLFLVFGLLLIIHGQSLYSQGIRPVYTGNNYATVSAGESMEQIIEKAANVTPSANQLAWQRLEFNAFIHFGINTFTGKEWGEGNEDPALFNPAQLDARQWVRVIRDGGMKMVIITAKHHDGFCLWPSQYTRHSVASSPWKKGKGDVVGEVAAACREYGVKFGFYLSPWDKHEKTYGDSAKYNEFFRNQLRELLTRYGEVSEVWFDGACGKGSNGKKQVYDWNSYYALIRELQPGAVIAIMGPDVRWVGTESGRGRETEWSVVPDVVQNLDSVAASSQQHPVDGAFIPGDLTASDIGSRDRLKDAKALVWYPAETDVSIRPGWFYHSAGDNRVKSPEKLAGIYFSSVGMNSVLLLNIPPDKSGLIHDNDIRSLHGMKKIIDQAFHP